MSDNRYPIICFNKIKSYSKDENEKYNWFIQIRERFFEPIGKAELWESLTLDTLTSEKENLSRL